MHIWPREYGNIQEWIKITAGDLSYKDINGTSVCTTTEWNAGETNSVYISDLIAMTTQNGHPLVASSGLMMTLVRTCPHMIPIFSWLRHKGRGHLNQLNNTVLSHTLGWLHNGKTNGTVVCTLVHMAYMSWKFPCQSLVQHYWNMVVSASNTENSNPCFELSMLILDSTLITEGEMGISIENSRTPVCVLYPSITRDNMLENSWIYSWIQAYRDCTLPC